MKRGLGFFWGMAVGAFLASISVAWFADWAVIERVQRIIPDDLECRDDRPRSLGLDSIQLGAQRLGLRARDL